MSPQTKAIPILFIGVLTFSASATLIKLAQAPALVIAFYRLAIATAIVGPWALILRREELRALSREQLLRMALGGVALALHFVLWISSLKLTSVASSVVLVTTTPIFVGLISHFFLGEKVSRRMALGIAVAFAGSLVIGWGDLKIAGRAAWGDILALLGALASSAYYLTGRVQRAKVSLLSYAAITYATTTLVLALFCLATSLPFSGYDARTWLMFLLQGSFPQAIGYSAINWALGYVPATLVTVAILGEPITSPVLAWLVLGEVPPYNVAVGGALTLGGIYLALAPRKAITN